MAISQTLSLQESGISSLRFMPESLLLTAACLWLVNSLHARPEDGPASRDLMRATLPVTEEVDTILDVLAYNTRVRPPWQHEEEEEDDLAPPTGVPYNPYGCIFFRRLMLAGDKVDVPRFRIGGPGISPSSFQFFFDGMTIAQVQAKFQKCGIIDKAAIAKIRSTTNKCSGVQYGNVTGAPEPILFDLSTRGHVLLPTPRDDGSDVEDRPTPPPEDRPEDIDVTLSELWRQFVMDITLKSPNQKGMANPSYLRLTNRQRLSGNEAPYKHLRLPEVFNAVWYKNATMDQWQTCFNWLFPPPGRLVTNAAQNYHTCTYYRKWMNILEVNQRKPKLIEEIRDEFFARISQWSWIPCAQADKMWTTSAKKPSSKHFTRWPPALDRPPAPHILLHSRAVPILDIPQGEVVDDESDEMGARVADNTADQTDDDS